MFYGWVIVHKYIPLNIYPFIYWWVHRLFLHLGYCKYSYNEHTRACIFRNSSFHFIQINKYSGVELLDCIVVLFLNVWGIFMLFSIVDVQICIPTYRVSFAPNPNQQLFLVVLKNNHPDKCEIFHYGFDLHSPDISDSQHLLYIYIYITI